MVRATVMTTAQMSLSSQSQPVLTCCSRLPGTTSSCIHKENQLLPELYFWVLPRVLESPRLTRGSPGGDPPSLWVFQGITLGEGKLWLEGQVAWLRSVWCTECAVSSWVWVKS